VLHWCGEHAPRPDVALPPGWAFATTEDGRTYASNRKGGGWCGIDGDGLVSARNAPPEVVLAVIAAHRARVGGVS
jgi:hypothetical protein